MRTAKTKNTRWGQKEHRFLPASIGRGGAVPFIRLSGQWLEKAGFDIGDIILVATENGKLTITFEKEED